MKLKGIKLENMTIEVSLEDIIKNMYNEFGFDEYSVLRENGIYRECGIGQSSSEFEYGLITNDNKKIEIFKALEVIKNSI